MSECSHDCKTCGSDCKDRKEAQSFREPANQFSSVKHVIGVVSGKGGVGKSLVTSLLASGMQKKGFQAAILDADITGPSIPKMFGLDGQVFGSEQGIEPAVSEDGTKIISMNLMLENDTDPVVWRGPVIAGVVKQFWTDVHWGEVDYMFVDMPPGTGDVPLTVFQSLPVDGIVIVTSPQELVSMIVGKAANMAEKMNIPVLAIVENMSYFECPDCGKRHSIYGESHIEELAASYCIDTVSRIPIDPSIAAHCDAGRVEEIEKPWTAEVLKRLEEL